MSHAAPVFLFPVQYLEVCESLIRSRDGDLAQFHARCGVSQAVLLDPNATLDARQLKTAFAIAREYCAPGTPPVLQILEHFPLTAHGLLGMLALASRTVGEALTAAVEFFPLVMPAFAVRRENHHDEVHLIFERLCDFGEDNDFFTELVMSVLHKIMPFTLEPLAPVQVCFTHRPEGAAVAAAYEAVIGVRVQFQAAQNRIVLPRKILDIALITQSPAMRRLLEASLRQRTQATAHKPVTQRVKRHLKLLLDENRVADGEVVAEAMAMSRRTLTRRLSEEGSSLPQVQNEVRIEYAEWLLLNSQRSIAEIARKAGFTDAANFTRAYKRITGKTPTSARAGKG
jgi:AraC-like DNA-binding protein